MIRASSRFEELMGLRQAPVAIAFRDSAPEGLERRHHVHRRLRRPPVCTAALPRAGLCEGDDVTEVVGGDQPREHLLGLVVVRLPRVERLRLDREVGRCVQRRPVADIEDRGQIRGCVPTSVRHTRKSKNPVKTCMPTSVIR